MRVFSVMVLALLVGCHQFTDATNASGASQASDRLNSKIEPKVCIACKDRARDDAEKHGSVELSLEFNQPCSRDELIGILKFDEQFLKAPVDQDGFDAGIPLEIECLSGASCHITYLEDKDDSTVGYVNVAFGKGVQNVNLSTEDPKEFLEEFFGNDKLRDCRNPDIVYAASLKPTMITSTQAVQARDSSRAEYGKKSSCRKGVFGENVNVAIIDTGIKPKTAKGSAGELKVERALDFTLTPTNRLPPVADVVRKKHGTHVATIVANSLPNAKCSDNAPAGVTPMSTIYDLRVCKCKSGYYPCYESDLECLNSSVERAIDWVMANNADETADKINIVNISMADDCHDALGLRPISKSVSRLKDSGVVVVASHGNSTRSISTGTQCSMPPGASPDAITVAGVNHQGYTDRRKHTNYKYYLCGASSVGAADKKPNIAAPAEAIYLPRYTTVSGTSYAAPFATGAAAAMLSMNPQLKPTEVKCLLQAGADREIWTKNSNNRVCNTKKSDTWSAGFGYGELNVWESLKLMEDSSNACLN